MRAGSLRGPLSASIRCRMARAGRRLRCWRMLPLFPRGLLSEGAWTIGELAYQRVFEGKRALDGPEAFVGGLWSAASFTQDHHTLVVRSCRNDSGRGYQRNVKHPHVRRPPSMLRQKRPTGCPVQARGFFSDIQG